MLRKREPGGQVAGNTSAIDVTRNHCVSHDAAQRLRSVDEVELEASGEGLGIFCASDLLFCGDVILYGDTLC